MSISDETVSFSLEINVKEAQASIRKIQTILYRTLGLMQRLGLPEDLKVAVSRVQQLIMVLNQLRLAAIALQAASGPIGWALAGIGAATFIATGLDFGDNLYDDMRGA